MTIITRGQAAFVGGELNRLPFSDVLFGVGANRPDTNESPPSTRMEGFQSSRWLVNSHFTKKNVAYDFAVVFLYQSCAVTTASLVNLLNPFFGTVKRVDQKPFLSVLV